MFYCLNCFPAIAAKIARSKRISVKEYTKAQGTAYSKNGRIKGTCTAMNEVNVHSKAPQQALRGNVSINGKKSVPWFVGDGVIVATAFGSTGYFYSCTGSKFPSGLGVAIINPTRPTYPIVILAPTKKTSIRISLTRRNGLFFCDNNHKSVKLEEGDYVLVGKSSQKSRIVRI
jgi:NAD kinase